MCTYIDLLVIAFICVLVIDKSGFIESIKSGISSILTNGRIKNSDYRIKPFDCSLCSTWWCGLVYLIVTGSVSLMSIGILLLIAIYVTEIISNTLDVLEKWILKILGYAYGK